MVLVGLVEPVVLVALVVLLVPVVLVLMVLVVVLVGRHRLNLARADRVANSPSLVATVGTGVSNGMRKGLHSHQRSYAPATD